MMQFRKAIHAMMKLEPEMAAARTRRAQMLRAIRRDNPAMARLLYQLERRVIRDVTQQYVDELLYGKSTTTERLGLAEFL